MTYLFNDPAEFANEAADGFARAYARYVRRVTGGVVRRRPLAPGHVAVVIGGGSGHYPAFAGLVGEGLAAGAAMGNVFASPSAQQICSVARAVEAHGGVLFCFGNYAGDVLNFGEAEACLAAEGVPCVSLPVTDDVASAPDHERVRRRGIAGGLVVYKIAGAAADEGADLGWIELPNLPPEAPRRFRASEIVSAGFLDLVRYGVRRPDDSLVADSLRVVDRLLRVDTPYGPVWRRYNHDGYGERDDGGPYADWGVGRAWPLLTGERGHYELALGRDPGPYLSAMERFATATGLLTEQVWDETDRPALHLALGRPTEAAMPLAWAHAEYISLLRSVADGRIFDQVPEVSERYAHGRGRGAPIEVWTFRRRPAGADPSAVVRVVADVPFRLHASEDDWRSSSDLDSRATGLDLHYVDLAPLGASGRSWRFTFYWPLADRWEGRDYAVTAAPLPRRGGRSAGP